VANYITAFDLSPLVPLTFDEFIRETRQLNQR